MSNKEVTDKHGFRRPPYGDWSLTKDGEWQRKYGWEQVVTEYVFTVDGERAMSLNPKGLSPEYQRLDGSIYSFFYNPGGRRLCFVATSAFEDQDHPTVDRLRDFRDEVLAESRLGRVFTAAYYGGLGPAAARVLDSTPSLKPMVRAGLETLVTNIVEPALQKRETYDIKTQG